MADIKTPEARSQNMAKIRSKDTKPEAWFRKRLFERGYRYRKNVNNIPGHPDAWLAKYNAAIFVNGCFWHRHNGCKYAYMPKSRVEFWNNKFQNNIRRDNIVRDELREKGIRMLVVWECTVKKMIKNSEVKDQIMKEVDSFIHSEDSYLEI